MFKAAKQKEITVSQYDQRVEYTIEKPFSPIQGFWDGVLFTDEAHLALDDLSLWPGVRAPRNSRQNDALVSVQHPKIR